jgi:hypothetical protein
MHYLSTEPPVSVFYNYTVYPYRRPMEMDGGRAAAPVIIVGAGPIGMVTAIDLARFGVASIVLEQELQISHGSRAIVLTRRSMEILQQVGVHKPFLAKGLPWSNGRSFYRGEEVYQVVMPYDEDDRFLPGLNLQQQYMEEFLVDSCRKNALIDLRWGQKVVAVSQTDTAVTLRIDTPDGEYDLSSDWVVAADGAARPSASCSIFAWKGAHTPAILSSRISRPTAAGFLLIVFSGADGLTDRLKGILTAAANQPFPVVRMMRMIVSARPLAAATKFAELVIADPVEHMASRYAAQAGTVYLLRPDLHVCARWRQTEAAQPAPHNNFGSQASILT